MFLVPDSMLGPTILKYRWYWWLIIGGYPGCFFLASDYRPFDPGIYDIVTTDDQVWARHKDTKESWWGQWWGWQCGFNFFNFYTLLYEPTALRDCDCDYWYPAQGRSVTIIRLLQNIHHLAWYRPCSLLQVMWLDWWPDRLDWWLDTLESSV